MVYTNAQRRLAGKLGGLSKWELARAEAEADLAAARQKQQEQRGPAGQRAHMVRMQLASSQARQARKNSRKA